MKNALESLMPTESKDAIPADPVDAFRAMRDSYLDAMSKMMINAVNTEEYAKATGVMLNSTMMLSAPFREAMDKAIAGALQQASMPSRQEVTALGGRLTNIEIRLDDLDSKLDRIIELCSVRPEPSNHGDPQTKSVAAPDRKTPHQGSGRKG
jgi:hypothetical protein